MELCFCYVTARLAGLEMNTHFGVCKGAVFGIYLKLNNQFHPDTSDNLNGNIVVTINYPEVMK